MKTLFVLPGAVFMLFANVWGSESSVLPVEDGEVLQKKRQVKAPCHPRKKRVEKPSTTVKKVVRKKKSAVQEYFLSEEELRKIIQHAVPMKNREVLRVDDETDMIYFKED